VSIFVLNFQFRDKPLSPDQQLVSATAYSSLAKAQAHAETTAEEPLEWDSDLAEYYGLYSAISSDRNFVIY
jgi:hypothetical protein